MGCSGSAGIWADGEGQTGQGPGLRLLETGRSILGEKASLGPERMCPDEKMNGSG